MKKILILIALVLSLGVVAKATPSTNPKAVTQMSCCCVDNDVPAKISGQMITGYYWNPKRTRVLLLQFDSDKNLISQRNLVPNAFGYYGANLTPCYDYFLAPMITKDDGSLKAYEWFPLAVFIHTAVGGSVETYDFTLQPVR